MAKDPAFLLYTNDFSTGTQFLSDDQLGKYMRLLFAQHQHGHLNERQMMHICKSYDKDIFIKFEKDDNDMFFNDRLDFEIERRKKYSSSRSNNKSGRKKQLNDDLQTIPKESYDNHMETVTVTVNRNTIYDFIDKKEFVEIFDKWIKYKKGNGQKYKNQISLKQAYEKLVDLSAGDIRTAVLIINDAIANNYAGFFALKNKPNAGHDQSKLQAAINSADRVTQLMGNIL